MFEGKIAATINAMHKSVPIHIIGLTLDGLRFVTTLGEIQGDAWSQFLNPQTRDDSKRFWLYYRFSCLDREADGPLPVGVVEGAELETILNAPVGPSSCFASTRCLWVWRMKPRITTQQRNAARLGRSPSRRRHERRKASGREHRH